MEFLKYVYLNLLRIKIPYEFVRTHSKLFDRNLRFARDPRNSSVTPASFYKLTKFSSLKITIFDLKMMVKSGLCRIFYFEIHRAPSELLLPSAKNLPRKAELARQVSRYLWRGSVDFKKKSRPFFIIIFKSKNGNFKTRDFSPLIERVVAGVVPLHEIS